MEIIEFIPKDRIRIDSTSVTWQEAVESVGEILLESEVIEERYIAAMVETVNELGPYIVITPGVAIAHARPEDGVIKPGLACLKTVTPIFFGNKENDPVNIVFGLAAKDHEQHVDSLRKIAELLMDDNKKARLLSAKNVSEITEVLNSIS